MSDPSASRVRVRVSAMGMGLVSCDGSASPPPDHAPELVFEPSFQSEQCWVRAHAWLGSLHVQFSRRRGRGAPSRVGYTVVRSQYSRLPWGGLVARRRRSEEAGSLCSLMGRRHRRAAPCSAGTRSARGGDVTGTAGRGGRGVTGQGREPKRRSGRAVTLPVRAGLWVARRRGSEPALLCSALFCSRPALC